jgi:hypothetical protein
MQIGVGSDRYKEERQRYQPPGGPMKKPLVVLAVVLAVISAAHAAQRSPRIVLEIGLPNGAAPQLTIMSGGTGTVSLPDGGRFGFVPTLRDGSVTVEVFDLGTTPHRRLGAVDAVPGGAAVRSGTKPDFGLRILRVIEG